MSKISSGLLVGLTALLIGLTTLPSLLTAQEIALKLDPARTTIQWSLPATAHTVHGTFLLKRGTLRFDPATGQAQGEIVVDMLSAQSGNGSRDKKMHKDVLETPKFAEASFVPTRVEGQWAAAGASKLTFLGTIKLHGADHPLKLEAQIQKSGADYAADTRFVVPFVEWGMKDPSFFAFRVENKVAVEIKATGSPVR